MCVSMRLSDLQSDKERTSVLPDSEPALLLLQVEDVRNLRLGHARDPIEILRVGGFARFPHLLKELDRKRMAVTQAEEIRRDRVVIRSGVGRGEVGEQESENDIGYGGKGDSPRRFGDAFMFA
jgi:hypothetical protein